MKRLRFALEWLALAALVLLAESGIYDIAAGVRASEWYIGWHGEQYGALPVSSVVFTYVLGVFRGTVTLGCAAAGLVGVAGGRLRLRYFLLLGVCILVCGGASPQRLQGKPCGGLGADVDCGILPVHTGDLQADALDEREE